MGTKRQEEFERLKKTIPIGAILVPTGHYATSNCHKLKNLKKVQVLKIIPGEWENSPCIKVKILEGSVNTTTPYYETTNSRRDGSNYNRNRKTFRGKGEKIHIFASAFKVIDFGGNGLYEIY